MPDTRRVIRVFLASPGDLQDERHTAKAVVDEFNKLWADALGYHVELVGWEDTLSQYGRPQDLINQDLARCELVIGMMWKRWGTPPSKTGPYTSGFEEEFETSLESRRTGGRPELALFFKEIDSELLRDPGDELKKVLTFKERIIAEKEIFYKPFEDKREFEGLIRGSITAHVQKLIEAETQIASTPTQTSPAEPQPTEVPAKRDGIPTISTNPANFLRRFIANAEIPDDDNQYTAVDVARFRLLAATVTHVGNDSASIGTHDSNLLFLNRDALDLDARERSALVRSGLEHFAWETVPLWHWYASIDGFDRRIFAKYSFMRGSQQTGALLAMRLIDEQLPSSEESIQRSMFLKRWFAPDAISDVKRTALAYLADCGLPEDLPAIKTEYDRGDYQTRDGAAEAIIRISLRQGRDQAVKALYDLQPDAINRHLLSEVFKNDAALDDTILTEGTKHGNGLVRRTTAAILARRNKLQPEDAERLLTDSDDETRYIALSKLIRSGRIFSEVQAKAVLVQQGRGGILGSFGLPTGEAQFERYRRDMLAKKSDTELEGLAASQTVFDRDASLALLERNFADRKGELAALVSDQFKTDFETSFGATALRFGSDTQTVKDIRNLEVHLRKGFTRRGLDIICRSAEVEHLGLVRSALASDFIGYSRLDVEYLRKHGEWQDIPLLIAAEQRIETSASFLSSASTEKLQTIARSIYAIGKDRLGELLELEMPKHLLTRVLLAISDRGFKSITQDRTKRLLFDSDDSVRKVTALKAIRSFPKKRVIQLLQEYVDSDEQHFYNVVHWLDLGVSAPKDLAQKAAAKVLAKEWPDD
jgi:hypothetical protein